VLILLPPTKNPTLPEAFKVTVIEVEMPLLMVPETVGAPIDVLSLTFVTVIEIACVAEFPFASVALTVMS
jgi:hypothetical protein